MRISKYLLTFPFHVGTSNTIFRLVKFLAINTLTVEIYLYRNVLMKSIFYYKNIIKYFITIIITNFFCFEMRLNNSLVRRFVIENLIIFFIFKIYTYLISIVVLKYKFFFIIHFLFCLFQCHKL